MICWLFLGNGGNFRAGQVIPHDVLLNYQCPGEAERDPTKPPIQCKLGHLVPSNPHCGVLGHSNTDWLGNVITDPTFIFIFHHYFSQF